MEQARSFKRYLTEKATGTQSGAPLSRATSSSTLRALQAFFKWLADQPGYRSAIRYSDAEYFAPARQHERIAGASRERPGPEIEDVLRVLAVRRATTAIERRNQAIVALTLLTGVRDRAMASLKLKHLDMDTGILTQDAREVRTKHGKTITTAFFPVGDQPLRIVADWVAYLKTELRFEGEDPLFPATMVAIDANHQFAPIGLTRNHWTTTAPIRNVFKEAFSGAGLPYHNPHSLRSTLARLGEQICRTPEEFKAWSQNLGHSGVLTTFSAYGNVTERRQCEIIAKLSAPQPQDDIVAELAKFLETKKRRVPTID